jgi:hypothetical protein
VADACLGVANPKVVCAEDHNGFRIGLEAAT